MADYFTKDGDEYKPVDENLLTQAETDKVVENRLERERKKFADYDELKEKAGKVDSVKQEYEDKLKKAGDETTDLKNQLKKSQLETDKVKIVNEFKLSEDLAEFVDGDDADAMRAKAEKLAKSAGGGKVVIKKDDKPGSKETDSSRIAKKLFKPQAD